MSFQLSAITVNSKIEHFHIPIYCNIKKKKIHPLHPYVRVLPTATVTKSILTGQVVPRIQNHTIISTCLSTILKISYFLNNKNSPASLLMCKPAGEWLDAKTCSLLSVECWNDCTVIGFINKGFYLRR